VTPRARVFVALGTGLAAGIAYPLVDLAIACRAPASEACVWGRAYLPLTFALSVPIVGAVVAWIVHAVLVARSGR
jgi:hypothetical protein